MNNGFIKSIRRFPPYKAKWLYLVQRGYAIGIGSTKKENWVLRWDLKMKGYDPERLS